MSEIECVCVCVGVCVCTLSHVQPFVTPMDYSPARLLCPWNFPGKNTGASCHFLLQEISPTQGLNPVSLATLALEGGFFTS